MTTHAGMTTDEFARIVQDWLAKARHPRFMGFVRHTDSELEWTYDRASTVGRLDQTLDTAKTEGWTIVDMKRDWKSIFPR